MELLQSLHQIAPPQFATQAIAGNARCATPLARAIIADREQRAARRLDETFITKAGSSADMHGCPLETLQRAKLRDSDGRPSTPLGAAIVIIVGRES